MGGKVLHVVNETWGELLYLKTVKPWCIEVGKFEKEVAYLFWFVFVTCFQYKNMKIKKYRNVSAPPYTYFSTMATITIVIESFIK
jgi:hypothetical protein